MVHNGDGCPIWTPNPRKGLANAQNAFEHRRGHASKFPEYSNAAEYITGARDFLLNMFKDAVTKVRKSSDIVVYQPSTEKFAVYTPDGTPRTFMRVDPSGFSPNSGIRTGMDHFNA
ncbi:hypothetical protein GCM10008957_04520 [Deinococcus ruber]|uniref:Uncharacterized protein n=1 Tax=Deinococcus ruber TaxID=1848197 RepID=A0A918BX39_9DEIO|nr:hypothetical protein GCM10008957_04520 [Deinococcus ruber]